MLDCQLCQICYPLEIKLLLLLLLLLLLPYNMFSLFIGYPAMGMYLNKTGRPIVYSCEWPLQNKIHHTKVPQ